MDIMDLQEKAGLRGWVEWFLLVSRIVCVGLSGIAIGVTETVGWLSFLK
jgi:hypothetical protein